MKSLHLLLACAALALCSCDSGKTPEATTGSTAGKDSASSEAPAPKGSFVVGFSQIGAESSWRTAETQSIRDEAAARQINLKFSDAQQKAENQIKALNTFLAQGVSAIILAPVIETGWEPVLREIKKANIPVILVDRGVKVSDESLYTTLIASDFVEEGRMAGDWLAKKLNGKCNIVELQGSAGAAPAIDRKKGFAEAIAKHPEMKIVKSQSGDFTRSKGKEVMEAFLKSDAKNIQAVYAHNDDMALGAIQVLDPNAGISFGYEAHQFELASGDEAYGLLASETEDEIAVKDLQGIVTTFRKSEVAARKQLSTSIMPAGLAEGLSPQELVDLVEFLAGLKKP